MSNVEQGISNDEVQSVLFDPSVFVIRYSIFCGSLLLSRLSTLTSLIFIGFSLTPTTLLFILLYLFFEWHHDDLTI